MNRIVFLLAGVFLLGGLVAWYLGALGSGPSGLSISTTLYDTDADGNVDLTVQRIDGAATTWAWDRDNDGTAEITAYDAVADAEGGLRPTGSITAWDIGNDGILDEGSVPSELQQLLRSEAFAQSVAAAGAGNLELVDMQTREFVGDLRSRYDDWRLAGLRLPIVGAHLPDADRLLPGAPRAYRFGVHQGFDMYPGHVGAPTDYGGPAVAAKEGTVVRADIRYTELTAQQYTEAIATSRAAGTTPPGELDLLRGRQVWLDHGHGVITRYAHLSAIAPGITEGTRVEAGAIVGFVGNSGMEAAATGSRSGAHLHFELRVDGRYLGEGLPPGELRELARRIFKLPAQ